MRIRGWTFFLTIAIAGCGVNTSPPGPARLPKTTPANSTLREDDPELDAAIAKARATLPTFIRRLEHPQPREVFSIEAEFAANDGAHEHLWLDDVAYRDGKFTGKLRNKPARITSIHAGDQVAAKEADVTDWTIFTSGRGEGGYTVDVLLRREGEPR